MILAEILQPGFSTDLTTWVFGVTGDGQAAQYAWINNSRNRFRRRERAFSRKLDPAIVQELVAVANASGFATLAANYEANCTDQPTVALSFTIGVEMKRVVAYGPGFLAFAGSTEMQMFVKLWNQVMELVPYGGNRRRR